MKHSDYLVPLGKKVRLADHDADDTGEFKNREQADKLLEKHRERLFELQELMYAEDKHALLVILQAMDAGGKDGAIRHIFTGVNPQGCQVTSFKEPTPLESQHDFLWREHFAVPPRRMIGVFNRSYYESVLIVRVHGEISDANAEKRFDAINNFEKLLVENHTSVLKFFLHISKDEQRDRLQARLDHPKKYWKVSDTDLRERKFWDEYVTAYEDVFTRCNTNQAPWYIIPANKKWFRNAVISQILVDTLEGLKMKYPKAEFDRKKMKLT